MNDCSAARAVSNSGTSAYVRIFLACRFEIGDHRIEKSRGLAAGDDPVVEGERERQHAVHDRLPVGRNHLVAHAPGPENRDGGRHHDRCRILGADHAEIRQRDRVATQFLRRDLARDNVGPHAIESATQVFRVAIRDVAGLTDLPLLQKDFITRATQIEAAVEMGAAAILLTAQILPKTALPKLIEMTLGHGLTPFVEVIDEDELGRVTHADECVVAINNKNIKQQERDAGDIDVSRAMLEPAIRTGTPCPVSASAITDPRVGAELIAAGFKGLLIGTGLLRSGSVQGWVDEFERHRAVLGSGAPVT